MAGGGHTAEVDGRRLRLTNLDKVLYPDGFTKAEVLHYYTAVAPVLVAHVARRPMTLKRWPDGVGHASFYEKACPDHRPDWLATVDVPSARSGAIRFCTIDDRASLVWAANLAALELHPLLAAAPKLDHPLDVVFDLDPTAPATVVDAASVALVLRDVLAGLGLTARVKSSGSKGLHLGVALDGRAGYAATKAFAKHVATAVEREWPDLVTTRLAKAGRAGRVLIDWSQNDRHKSTVAPYSLRAVHGHPTVSAPLTWDEVAAVEDDAVLHLAPAEVLDRLDRIGDLWSGRPQPLPGTTGGPTATPTGGAAADEALARYRAMRRFDATPEPVGDAGPEPASGDAAAPTDDAGEPPRRFVIQQHDATRLHWDLRLEHEGVLQSWALPRCLPWSPAENHLAVHTEDHPLEYLTFSGDIPAGNYGAGSMFIWDRGTYDVVSREERKVVVELHGERVVGRYALFATRGRDWMIHRMDSPTDPDRRPPPTDWRPMRATPGPLPPDDGTLFEVCWPGRRALLVNTPGETVILDADGGDVSAAFPEIRRISRALGSTEVVLDGVIVEWRDGGPVDEPVALDRRRDAGASALRRLARDHPARFLAFDLLWRDGHPWIDRPGRERRAALENLGLDGPAWSVPSAHEGDGAALLDALATRGGRGLVAKRLDAPYVPGTRTPHWVLVPAPGSTTTGRAPSSSSSRRSDLGGDRRDAALPFGAVDKASLERLARERRIPGRSGMNKAELVAALAEAEQSVAGG